MDEIRIPPAGDPFYAASRRDQDDYPHGCPYCFGGYVTITIEEGGEDYDEPVRCRRCAREES